MKIISKFLMIGTLLCVLLLSVPLFAQSTGAQPRAQEYSEGDEVPVLIKH